MLKKSSIFKLGFCLMWGASIGAQNAFSIDAASFIKNSSGKTIFIEDSNHVQALSLSGTKDQAGSMLRKHGKAFGLLNPAAELFLESEAEDSLRMSHFSYQQVYKGIPVFGAKAKVHLGLNGKQVMQAEIVPNIDLDIVPNISSAQAQGIALENIRETIGHETPLEIINESSLVIFSPELLRPIKSSAPILAYQVTVFNQLPPVHQQLLINANTGAVELSISKIHHEVNRRIFDCSPGNGTCYLNQPDPQFPGFVLGRSEGQPARGINPRYRTADTDIIYDIMGGSHSYFAVAHGRNGANQSGGISDGTRAPTSQSIGFSFIDPLYGFCPNAFWDGIGSLNFCVGLATPDIGGHEYAHAVTTFSANLLYQFESGALNESFSDIFGEAVERHITGANDWLIGTGSSIGILRNMQKPGNIINRSFNLPYPDRFYSPNFYCGDKDEGGIHHNSSVLNHVAYLMAVGGTLNGCTIQGIGPEKQERILYRALTNYLVPTSGFNATYNAVIAACNDLYPSSDCFEVTKALRAAELDQPGRCSGVPARAPDCTSVPGPSATPIPQPSPNSAEPLAQSLSLSKNLLKRSKSSSSFALNGQVSDVNGQLLTNKAVLVTCSFNGVPQSAQVLSNNLGYFLANATVGKKTRAVCQASADQASSNLVKIVHKKKKKKLKRSR